MLVEWGNTAIRLHGVQACEISGIAVDPSVTPISSVVCGGSCWTHGNGPYDNMLTKYEMITFIDFCEVWFLPELVARVAAIDRNRHTLRNIFKETLDVFLGYRIPSSLHALPK
ncbi:hypothetical protein TNCV_3266261 [Trichonephila clavipes]|nr:hypothetical protein TNCV_3266261 [Trichonephila clavipes]